jgi:FtsP/CotA-like multicopper oxidase with cupredoxin domain
MRNEKMKYQHSQTACGLVTRRNFLQSLAVGGSLLTISSKFNLAKAALFAPAATELSGTEFDLTIDYSPANFTGKTRIATTVNGSIPAPTLRWKEGETVTLRVTNKLHEDASIHWHGIILPNKMDGVPGLTFGGIALGETFTYQFKVQQSGTYWYHSHSGFQEQTGLYGAIIIDPAQAETHAVDRDYVMVLSDWTDEDPMRLLQKLRMQSDYYNEARPTLQDFLADVRKEGKSAALNKRQMWNEMRMNPTDIADISGKTYTYLINGASPNANWTGLFKAGETIRLRFVNAATQSFFDVRIPGLKLTVIATDGQAVVPVEVDEFRCGSGETYDVLVRPTESAYTIFAQAMDRSGYASATLATQAGMVAAIPPLDKAEWLSMDDMMGDMMSSTKAHHAKTEQSVNVDMRVDTPRTNLDDPGVNLRDNGRKVLTYADLHSEHPPLDTRIPSREIELHLTGNMGRYLWSIDGVPFSQANPIHFNAGERLRMVVVNDTMMLHPFHLHGMWSDLENADGEFQVRKHTIVVQPAQRVSYLVSADALGRWALHCHLLYHMEAGMFREVVVA